MKIGFCFFYRFDKTFTRKQIKILKVGKKAAEDPKSGSYKALPGNWVDGKLMRHVQRTSACGKTAKIAALLLIGVIN